MVYIYTLELEGGKYYVGKSDFPDQRILKHSQGQGSAWTRLFPIREIYSVQSATSQFDEDKITKEMMSIFGVDNVRGGSYCQVDLPLDTRRFLEREIRGATDACMRCGRTSHFVDNCFAKVDLRGNPIDSPATVSVPSRSVSNSYEPPRWPPNNSHYTQPYDSPPNNSRYTQSQAFYQQQFEYYSDEDEDGSPYDNGNGGNGCFRCGREGHWVADCYAKWDVNGRRI